MVLLFNDTATTEIYTLSLHDALPIFAARVRQHDDFCILRCRRLPRGEDEHLSALQDLGRPRRLEPAVDDDAQRSEEHTSELQSRQYLVCRLLLEKKITHLTTLLPPSW